MANPIAPGTEVDYLLRCVALGLGRMATTGYALGPSDRGGRKAREIKCDLFGGLLTIETIKLLATRNPGLAVSITGVEKLTHAGDGDVDVSLQFGAALVTQCAGEWDGLAARVVQHVVTQMQWENWGTGQGRGGEGQPDFFLFPKIDDLRAENIFGQNSIKAGVTLWALSWQQVARLPGKTIVATADDMAGQFYIKTESPYGLDAGGPTRDRDLAEAAYTEIRVLGTGTDDPGPRGDWPAS